MKGDSADSHSYCSVQGLRSRSFEAHRQDYGSTGGGSGFFLRCLLVDVDVELDSLKLDVLLKSIISQYEVPETELQFAAINVPFLCSSVKFEDVIWE